MQVSLMDETAAGLMDENAAGLMAENADDLMYMNEAVANPLRSELTLEKPRRTSLQRPKVPGVAGLDVDLEHMSDRFFESYVVAVGFDLVRLGLYYFAAFEKQPERVDDLQF